MYNVRTAPSPCATPHSHASSLYIISQHQHTPLAAQHDGGGANNLTYVGFSLNNTFAYALLNLVVNSPIALLESLETRPDPQGGLTARLALRRNPHGELTELPGPEAIETVEEGPPGAVAGDDAPEVPSDWSSGDSDSDAPPNSPEVWDEDVPDPVATLGTLLRADFDSAASLDLGFRRRTGGGSEGHAPEAEGGPGQREAAEREGGPGQQEAAEREGGPGQQEAAEREGGVEAGPEAGGAKGVMAPWEDPRKGPVAEPWRPPEDEEGEASGSPMVVSSRRLRWPLHVSSSQTDAGRLSPISDIESPKEEAFPNAPLLPDPVVSGHSQVRDPTVIPGSGPDEGGGARWHPPAAVDPQGLSGELRIDMRARSGTLRP